jgi:hypothetical protein
MRRTLAHLLFAAGIFLAGASSTGCKQGEGDRCEVASDCSGGLTCHNPSLTGGTCTSNPNAGPALDASADVRISDSGALVDASGADLGVSPDGATTDGAAVIDVAGGDATAADVAPDTHPDATDATPDSSSQ